VVIDRRQRIVAFNPSAERMFGFGADDIIGRSLDQLVPEHARSAHGGHVASFFHGDEASRWMHERRSIEGRKRNGATFPAQATIARFTIADEPYAAVIIQDLTDTRARERELNRLAEILEKTPDFVGLADAEGNITYHNAAARRFLGIGTEGTPRHVCQSHPDWAAHKVLRDGFPSAVEHGSWRGQTAILDEWDEEIPVDQVLIAHRDETGRIDCVSTIARDLRPQLALQSEIDRQARALEKAGDMIWITDTAGLIRYVNPAFEQTTGYRRDEAVGRKTGSLLASGEHSKSFYTRLWATLSEGRTFRAVFSNRTRDGRSIYVDETIAPVVDDAGRIEAFVATGRDVTERMRLEEQLRELAYQDPLTRLPNRAHLWERLAQATSHAERTGRSLAVLFLDLDGFKDINDAVGHPAGDEVLRQVAGRVADNLRRGDSIGRHGGDELLIVLEDIVDNATVGHVAEKILAAVRRPLEVDEKVFAVHASIGIAQYPDAGETPDRLVTSADAAMYQAKAAGGDRYAFHTSELGESVQERWFLLRALREAPGRQEISIQLQPIVRAGDRSLVGAEVFLRWLHPDAGWIDPARFIPVAEETGQIRDLGLWALRRACEQVAAWRAAGLAVPPLAVNASSVQLGEPGFADTVAGLLDETGLEPGALVIEMTETSFMAEGRHMPPTLEELRMHGVGIAIDDFGTGYSSLGYLKRFPADRIKLDRDFVRELPHDPANVAIVESVVSLGRAFGSTVVGEGVEREEEAAMLHRLGVAELQGFLFGRPMTVAAFEQQWLGDATGCQGRG